MSTPDVKQPGRDGSAALTKLADEIECGEFEAAVEAPRGGRGRARLRVRNRDAEQLAEDIYAAPDETGAWFFWWGWAERFAPVSDPAAAAAKVTRVLRALGK